MKQFLVEHSDRITDLVVSPDLKQILSASKDKTLIFGDLILLKKNGFHSKTDI